ncbi:hypothetical protein M5J15_02100 [Serratia symbiotica]|uniref:hypothetical protein n=1 Tax=Serratia symbiotica TaxID=138074 RepID=UPI00209001B9|nr:hypothetical protein [Serratia symbiotica]USS96875.1 hypothetical protein M5J15_02100 [Serratia symbiotica]
MDSNADPHCTLLASDIAGWSVKQLNLGEFSGLCAWSERGVPAAICLHHVRYARG